MGFNCEDVMDIIKTICIILFIGFIIFSVIDNCITTPVSVEYVPGVVNHLEAHTRSRTYSTGNTFTTTHSTSYHVYVSIGETAIDVTVSHDMYARLSVGAQVIVEITTSSGLITNKTHVDYKLQIPN